jgi:hypothetical protein
MHDSMGPTMTKTSEQNGSRQAVGADRRRTRRVPLTFQIEVSGIDRNGTAFRERAITTNVNENGCRFDLVWQLFPGDLISISVISAHREGLKKDSPTVFQVVWVEPSDMGWSVGATTKNPRKIWHMAFPDRR